MMMMSQNMSSMHNNNTNTNNTSTDSAASAFAPLNTLQAATLPINNSSNSTLNNNNNNDANHSNSANSSSTSNASNNNAYDNSSNSLESLALSNSSSYLADSTSSLDSSTDRSLDGAASFKQLDDSQKKSKTAKKHCKNPSQKSKKQLSTRKPLGSSSGSEAASGQDNGASSLGLEDSLRNGNASKKRASPSKNSSNNSLHDLSDSTSEKQGSSSSSSLSSSSSSSSPTQSGNQYSITSGEYYYSYQNYRYRYQAKPSEILGSSTRCVKQASTLFAAAPSSDSFSFSGWHRNRFNYNNNNNNNNTNNNSNHHDRQHRHRQTSNPLCCMEKNQLQLRSAVREILSMSPIVGVYQDENQQQWKEFVAGLLEYFEGRADGPRAIAAAKMRADTAAAAASATEVHGDSELKVLLGTLGLELGKSSLKEISQKCDILLASSSVKRDLESTLSLLKKNENNLRELQQEGSRVRQAIIGGLMKKHTKIETSIRITKIIEDRIQENQELEEKIERLRENLEKDERARRVERIRELLGTSLAMWKESDKQAGRDTQESGRIFETEVLSDQSGCIDVILKRLGMIRENIAIHRGCSWENADGEVDIVLTDIKETKIVGVAEVKARVYDISAAYRQSGPHRSSSKNRILINGKALVAPRDPNAFFVLTTLPKNQFALPFESKLKDSLNKYFLNTQPADVDYDAVRLQLAPLYSTMISPLAWFDNYGESALIVAGNNTQYGQQCTDGCWSCQPCQSDKSAGEIVKAGRHQQDTDTDTDYDCDCDDSRESDCDDPRDRSLHSSHSRGSLHSVLSSSGFSNSITQEDDELEEYSEREQEEEEREEESEGEEEECLSKKSNRFLLKSTPINEELPNFKLFSLVQENKTTRTSVNTRTTTTTTTPTQPQPHPQPQPQNQLKQQQQLQLQQQQQQQPQQQQQQQITQTSVSQSQNNLHLHGKLLLLPLHGGLLGGLQGGLPLGGLPLLGGVPPVNFSEQVPYVSVVDPVVVVKVNSNVNQQENEETLKMIKEGKGGKGGKGSKGGKRGSSISSSGSRPTQDIKKIARKPTKCEELKRGSRSSLPSVESVLSSVNVSTISESSPIEGNSESSSSEIESSSESSSSSSSAGESGDMEGAKYVSSIQAISQEAKLFEGCSSDSSRPVKVEDSFESLANQTLKIHLITPIPQPQC